MNATTTETTDKIHRFERAGLGLAPFRIVGIRDTAAGVDENGMVWTTLADGKRFGTTPGGTCAYCSQAIIVLVDIKSADGKRFHVGSDCAGKTGDAGLVKRIARYRTEKRKAAADERIKAARGLLETVRPKLAAQPHPRGFEGLTLADWADWMLKNCGTKGRLEVAKVIEKAAR